MTTTENRELLRDALPALKALRYQTTISVPPDPSRAVGDGLSDSAVTLLERLDGKDYYVVDPEGGSAETRAAATELFEAGLLDLRVSGGHALYGTNDLGRRHTARISAWHRVRPDVLKEAKAYLVGSRANFIALFSDMPVIKVPKGEARTFLLDRGFIETIPASALCFTAFRADAKDIVAVTQQGQDAAHCWAIEARS